MATLRRTNQRPNAKSLADSTLSIFYDLPPAWAKDSPNKITIICWDRDAEVGFKLQMTEAELETVVEKARRAFGKAA